MNSTFIVGVEGSSYYQVSQCHRALAAYLERSGWTYVSKCTGTLSGGEFRRPSRGDPRMAEQENHARSVGTGVELVKSIPGVGDKLAAALH